MLSRLGLEALNPAHIMKMFRYDPLQTGLLRTFSMRETRWH